MPEVEVSIGGRFFEVACQEGEEQFLREAASMLDAEATALTEATGRLSESKMLLMAGLMLADNASAMRRELVELRAEADALRSQAELRETPPPAEPEPLDLGDLTALIDKSEALAGYLEEINQAR